MVTVIRFDTQSFLRKTWKLLKLDCYRPDAFSDTKWTVPKNWKHTLSNINHANLKVIVKYCTIAGRNIWCWRCWTKNKECKGGYFCEFSILQIKMILIYEFMILALNTFVYCIYRVIVKLLQYLSIVKFDDLFSHLEVHKYNGWIAISVKLKVKKSVNW